MCTTLVRKKQKNKKTKHQNKPPREKHTLRTEVLALRRAEQNTAINTSIPTKGNSFKQKNQIKRENQLLPRYNSPLQQLYATHKSCGYCKAAQSIKRRTISINVSRGEGQRRYSFIFSYQLLLRHVFVCRSVPLECLMPEHYHRITAPKTSKAM